MILNESLYIKIICGVDTVTHPYHLLNIRFSLVINAGHEDGGISQ